jgi:hypothetical protein
MKVNLFVAVLVISSFAQASNHYVLSGARGTADGSSWTNACTDFIGSCAAASLVRGDTYYVGAGTYGGATFSTPTSGTSVITIKGATVADHGTDTGWSSADSVSTADGGSPALWSNTITFTTSYWVFDGAVGSVLSQTPSDYGFSFGTTLSRGIIIGSAGSGGTCGSAVSNLTLAHFYGKATSNDTEKLFEEGNTYGGVLTNITFANFLLDGWQGLFMTKSGNCSSTPYTGWIVQYGVMLNGFSSSANHGEWINPNERPISGLIVRYNVFRGYSGTSGMTGTIVANNSDNDNAAIYGNVFDGLRVGNGVITGTSQGNLNNAIVYNNSFLNMTSDSGAAIGGSGQGSGNVAMNNVFYNTNAQQGGGFTFDYNSYFSTTNTPAEAHGQTGTGSPFINAANYNYQLAADTSAWTPLASPYNVDAKGLTRISSRGAYQFTTSSAVNPPTNLTAFVQ